MTDEKRNPIVEPETPPLEPLAPPAPAELAAIEVLRTPHLRWYHLEDPASPSLDQLAQTFQFHELEVEDCRHARQRAKIEEYENHIFVIGNTLHFMPETLGVWFGEIDIFVGSDFIVTVHLGPTRSVHDVLPRIQANPKLQRPDKVFYVLLDNIIDRYLPVLDAIGDRVDELEDEVWANPTPKSLADIFALKRGLIEFRRTVSQMREMVNSFLRLRAPYNRAEMSAYWRDVYDHLVRAYERIDVYRDLLTGVLDVHLTATANRTNSIMKALTIFGTISVPLLVITGYYGMNFENLPLLRHPLGFVVASVLMVVLAVGFFIYFRRQHWF